MKTSVNITLASGSGNSLHLQKKSKLSGNAFDQALLNLGISQLAKRIRKA